MRRIQFIHSYHTIISQENLLAAWSEFLKGKRKRRDVQLFHSQLIDNIQRLNEELTQKRYRHGGYEAFHISDPKPRSIHKATVRDRVVHRLVYRALYLFFDKTFIADSYSCRAGKGTHRAVVCFTQFARQVGKNDTKTVWVLKCDIRKFFAHIDHKTLLFTLQQYIADRDVAWLLEHIIGSFSSYAPKKGLPLGNLTSQLFVNLYMNEFDQFVKHKLKAKYYIRYADDFVVMSRDREWLEDTLGRMREFLLNRLCLELHPHKVSITTLASGVGFLGWVHFSDHRVLRTTTKRRMLRRIRENPTDSMVQSYLGLLRYGNTRKLQEVVRELM